MPPGRVRVLPTSTGNGKTFMDDGQQSISYTPRGRFLVYDKSVGWETGPLGSVFYPNYISGGVAIHGARSVPYQPASHGCTFASQFSRRAKLASFSRWEPLCWFTTRFRLYPAKDWVKNPKLKEAALLSLTAEVNDYAAKGSQPNPSEKETAPG